MYIIPKEESTWKSTMIRNCHLISKSKIIEKNHKIIKFINIILYDFLYVSFPSKNLNIYFILNPIKEIYMAFIAMIFSKIFMVSLVQCPSHFTFWVQHGLILF